MHGWKDSSFLASLSVICLYSSSIADTAEESSEIEAYSTIQPRHMERFVTIGDVEHPVAIILHGHICEARLQS
jgi:hypothetical protein